MKLFKSHGMGGYKYAFLWNGHTAPESHIFTHIDVFHLLVSRSFCYQYFVLDEIW